ncbi:MAG: hypothetical protein WC222_11490 [Parachlamydiales bacterium]|jgi:hypothetical protein
MIKKNGIIFKGIVKNIKPVFDHPLLWEDQLKTLEGSRFDLIIEKETKPKTVSQLGYLFGGVIETTCLGSTCFEGWTKEEVLGYLLTKLTSYPKEVHYPDGHIEIIITHDDISMYDKDQMKVFIDKAIIFLSSTHGLVVLTPDEYRYEKYFGKIHKKEKEW